MSTSAPASGGIDTPSVLSRVISTGPASTIVSLLVQLIPAVDEGDDSEHDEH